MSNSAHSSLVSPDASRHPSSPALARHLDRSPDDPISDPVTLLDSTAPTFPSTFTGLPLSPLSFPLSSPGRSIVNRGRRFRWREVVTPESGSGKRRDEPADHLRRARGNSEENPQVTYGGREANGETKSQVTCGG